LAATDKKSFANHSTRNKILATLNFRANMQLLGIDVGGTNLRLGVFEGLTLIKETRHQADFSIICKNNSPSVAWQQILNVLAEAISMSLAEHSHIQAIGIGFPGFIDPNSQTLAQSPNLPGLKNVNLAADLSKVLNKLIDKKSKIKQIILENDANAAAYGEYCLLNKPAAGLIYLGLGTGVGGGLIINGKPHVGANGCAMEAGHIIIESQGRQCGCGNKGCMEQYASASGVAISYFKATKKQLSAHEIADHADNGDKVAIAAYELAASALAQALASILKVVDVQNVVIGGGLTGAWHLMQAAFNARLDADLIPVLRGKVEIKISTANDTAGMLGAAMLSADMLALS
jgi:glucokinase